MRRKIPHGQQFHQPVLDATIERKDIAHRVSAAGCRKGWWRWVNEGAASGD
jgi:hypothetical protein